MVSERYRYTISPEFDGLATYAWFAVIGKNSGSVGSCVGSYEYWGGHIPISDILQKDFDAWAVEFENKVLSEPDDNPDIDWEYFHARGVELSKRLKLELGPESRVYYIKPNEDPSADCKYQVVTEDGTMKKFSPITDTVLDNLYQIEREHNVRVLYAVESGSRAWGFASSNSDFDVRFVYIHTLDWYLSLQEKRDVIEIPISDELDISGWDIQKALGLFNKSNPPLLEWLGSPIVYLDNFGFAERLRDILKDSFSPQRCLYHYLHMAKGNFREYLKGDVVRVKKYFYVLRPIFACVWLEKHNTMPPTEFERLYLDADLPLSLVKDIDCLLERKKAGGELDIEPRIEAINSYLAERIEYFSTSAKRTEKREKDIVQLDLLFKDLLHKAWETV